MKCEKFEEATFLKYLQDELEAIQAERNNFEEHVLVCDDCAARLYRSSQALENQRFLNRTLVLLDKLDMR